MITPLTEWSFTDLLDEYNHLKSIEDRDWKETYRLRDVKAELNRRCPAQEPTE